jgi:hypothetical protein
VRALIVSIVAIAAGAAPAAAAPAEFDGDARLFYRIVACAGTDPVDAKLDKVVASHCKWMAQNIAKYRKRYADPASALFAKLRPANLPATVVYPFGGGDLASALITYPDATEITTLSLEHAGDPTRLGQLTAKELKKYLATFRDVVKGLFANSDFESDKLKLLERGPIPGQLALHLTGAALLGYEPVGLRYFHVGDDGAVVYYTTAEIAALGKKTAKKKKGSWIDTDWSVAYTSMELSVRKAGDTTAPVIVHRHLATNLHDGQFAGSAVEKHLQAKGKVAAMTKAASYLLWETGFSAIRDYLATHLVWMSSDSTGIPPRHAAKAGLEQETYGKFTGAIFRVGKVDQAAFVKLWKKQPHRKLTFRYGYKDAADHPHLMITRPKGNP